MEADTLDPRPSKAQTGCWRIKPDGCFAVFDEQGRDVTPRGRKSRAILAYLSAHAGTRVPRERVMDLLWGDRGQAQARDSLRQALAEIRRSAGKLVEADREHVWIKAGRLMVGGGGEAGPDAELFDDLNHVTAEFDEWLIAERTRRDAEQWDRLQQDVEQRLAAGRGADAISLIEQMSEIDPYNEEWLRLAMRAEFQASNPAGIELRFKGMTDRLKRELGLLPSAETRELHGRLLAKLSPKVSAVAMAVQPAAPAAAAAPPPPVARWRRPASALAGAVAFVGMLGLSQSATSTTGSPPRIAVLPFAASAGVDPALAEGLSDELLSKLTRLQGLRVIGRTSAAQFRGGAADLRQAGRSLGANYLVEGKVSSPGGETRVLVSLVRVRDGSAVWARTFHGKSRDLQPIPAAIGSAVARSLGADAAPFRQSSTSPEAYALYVRAKSLIRNRDGDSLARAIELLRQAVHMDPSFAAAWAQLGGASRLSGQFEIELDPGSRQPSTITIRQAVRRALQLDPNLPEAHAMMSLVEPHASPSARAHLRRALQLDSGDTQTLYWWGGFLHAQGDFDSALENLQKVAALDPFWKLPVLEAVQAGYETGDEAAAERYLRKIRLGNPGAAREVEIFAAAARGDYSRAVELGLANRGHSRDFGSSKMIEILVTLDFRREALLLRNFEPVVRGLIERRATELPLILDFLESKAATGAYSWFNYILWQLARERRWSDIAAIHDAGHGPVGHIKSADPGGRKHRVMLGPLLALSLKKAGRDREAVQLAARAAEDAELMLRNRLVPREALVEIAGAETLVGKREEALAHLEQAFARGWRMDSLAQVPLRANPLFATLRDEPRFRKLAAIQDAHWTKESREIRQLRLI